MSDDDMYDDMHPCPKDGCDERIPFRRMACQGHWYSLPPELRDRVRKVWKGGWVDEILDVRKEVLAVLNGTPEVDGHALNPDHLENPLR